MGKLKKLALLIFLIAFFPRFSFGAAGELIKNFEAEITVNKDSSINITERIYYDFGSWEKHGIYRDIPYKYFTKQGNFNLRLSDFSVTDQNGAPYKFELSSAGKNKRLKIGDFEKLVSGTQIYNISYKAKRAVTYFETHDELYWNITGNEWAVPIERSSAKIFLPEKKLSGVVLECFAGALGSKTPCSGFSLNEGDKSADFSQSFPLGKNQGLTVVVGFPKGMAKEPGVFANGLDFFRNNLTYGFPLATFIILLTLWFRTGRDPRGKGVIIPQYEPPRGLSPAELGTILDERADKADLSAEILNLAVKGHLKITRTEDKKIGGLIKDTDYIFERIPSAEAIAGFQQDLLETLTANSGVIKLSDIKTEIGQDIKAVRDEVYRSVTDKGFFVSNPNKQRAMYFGAGLILVYLFLEFGERFFANWKWEVIPFSVSGLLLMIFGYFMPAKTKEGVLVKEEIEGFKLYLSVAEKARLEFHNAPEKSPEVFEKFLPYAMALKVEKQWAKQFEGIYENKNPGWYNDSNRAFFGAAILTESLGDFSSFSNRIFFGPSGGSGLSGGGGGGFSGGGGGGGGGGSW